MTRRDFLKQVHNMLVATAGASFFSFEELEALDVGEIQKPDLIWLDAMSCDGCTTSLLNTDIK